MEETEHDVISSLVVECMPESVQAIAAELPLHEGVEVHEINGNKLVVTIEAETVDASAELAAGFSKLPGVININLVYLNFEDDPTIYPASLSENA